MTTFVPWSRTHICAETSRTTFVLIHGMWGNRLQWQSWSDPTGSSNIWAIDLPGHGNDRTDLRLVSTATCVNRVIENVRSIKDGPIVLIGHSFGALVAQKVATEYPGVVDGLVLLASSPPAGIRLPIQLKFARYTWRILFGKVVDLTSADQRFLLGNTQTDLGSESGTVILETLLGECKVLPAQCPTLVVAGNRDQFLPIKTQFEIADLHHADFAAEDVGHMMHIDPVMGRYIRDKVFRWCHNHLRVHHRHGYSHN